MGNGSVVGAFRGCGLGAIALERHQLGAAGVAGADCFLDQQQIAGSKLAIL